MNVLEEKAEIAFHPGYYIEEIMEDLKMDLAEFARESEIPIEEIEAIIQGRIKIESPLAEKLSSYLGTGPTVWMNLQKAYDKKINALNISN